MKIRQSLRALSRAGSARSPDPDKGHRTDSLKNSSRKSTSQFCKVGEFPRQGDLLHPLWRSSWRTRSTSDKASYGAHGLALLHEIRTWCVVRQGGVPGRHEDAIGSAQAKVWR